MTEVYIKRIKESNLQLLRKVRENIKTTISEKDLGEIEKSLKMYMSAIKDYTDGKYELNKAQMDILNLHTMTMKFKRWRKLSKI